MLPRLLSEFFPHGPLADEDDADPEALEDVDDVEGVPQPAELPVRKGPRDHLEDPSETDHADQFQV